MSTSAVYTHFGSIDELRHAIRKTGFERLAQHLTSVDKSDDPVADLAKQGWAYCRNAIENPTMYRVMFMERVLDEVDAGVGLYTFQMLVDEVQRCMDAGRIKNDDAFQTAMPFWSSAHGAVTLHLAGMIDEGEVNRLAVLTARALLVELGDDPAMVDRSLGDAITWIAEQRR